MKNGPLAPGMGADAENIRISRSAVVAAALGNSFEWYDFTVYALFSIYIADAFFPGGGSTLALVKALLAFGLGFVARPLGAIVFGVYGDRYGRKAVLNLALLLMFLGTAVLGFAPTYAAIGVGAPLLILVGRALQGFSAGGEFGGAAAPQSADDGPFRFAGARRGPFRSADSVELRAGDLHASLRPKDLSLSGQGGFCGLGHRQPLFGW